VASGDLLGGFRARSRCSSSSANALQSQFLVLHSFNVLSVRDDHKQFALSDLQPEMMNIGSIWVSDSSIRCYWAGWHMAGELILG
jgi:hypothetical protein